MSANPNSLRLFLSELAKRPKLVGAIWPSSPALGRAMARRLPEHQAELVLELGPGTGIVTEELLAAGLPQERLVAVEKSERLAGFLRERYPNARVITGDALEIDRDLAGIKFGAVISSLPLKLFPPKDVARLAEAIHNVLAPGADWVQFSYQIVNGRVPGKTFRRVATEIVWQNFPPAKVSVYRRSV